jgi:hypothetical protein
VARLGLTTWLGHPGWQPERRRSRRMWSPPPGGTLGSSLWNNRPTIHPTALGMPGLVTPVDHGVERRLLLPTARHRHPDLARAMPPSVERTSGSSVRLPAKLTAASVMVLPFLVPGRAVWPALGPGGRWTPWHAERPPGASDRANEVGHRSRLPAVGRLGCRVGWSGCLWLGVEHASTVRPDPSTLGVVGERGSRREGRSPAPPRRQPKLGQVAEGGGGIVVSLATRPALAVRVAVLSRSDLGDDGLWSLLGQDVQEARSLGFNKVWAGQVERRFWLARSGSVQ